MATGMENIFLNPKEIQQMAFKKHLVFSLELFFYLWAVQHASAHSKADSASDAQPTRCCGRETGCLCLHWVPVLTAAAQPSQGWSDVICQSLTGVDCPPRELSLCSAKCNRRQAGPSPHFSASFQTSSLPKHQNHNWKRFSDCTAGGQ